MSDFEDRVRDELHQMADGAEPGPTLRQRIDARLGTGPPPMGRPPVALIAVAAAIVLVAVSLVVLSARGSGSGHNLVLTQGTATTAGPTSTVGGTAPGVPSVTATSAPPSSDSTTAAPSTTTSTVNPTTTTGPTSTTVGPTTTTVAIVACATSDLLATTTTDKASYPVGQVVTITVTIKNVSAQRCQIAAPLANPFVTAIAISMGSTVVWQPAAFINGIATNNPRAVDPGESYAWATVEWDQHGCVSPCTRQGPEGAQVAPGQYQASPVNPPGIAIPALFTIK